MTPEVDDPIANRFARQLAVVGLIFSVASCSEDSSGGAGGGTTGNDAGSPGGSAGKSGSGGSGETGGASGTGAAGESGSAGTGGSAGGTGSDGAAGAAPCVIAEVQTIADEPTHLSERFSYTSTNGLSIYGESCRPKGAGPFPVLFWNHGGFEGLGAGDRDLCANFAINAGWAVFMSEYRGEGGSEGSIEICLGEAEDVIALARCATAQSWVDPARMIMAGGSHGGCITLASIARGAPVAAAVDVFGPTDWKKEHAFWTTELAAAPQGPWAAAYQALIDRMEQTAGGTPATAGAAYDLRSPVQTATQIAAFPGSLLMIHGVEDELVPPEQSCALAEQAGSFAARHYDASAQTPLSTPPTGCETSALSWLTTPKPSPAWPGDRHVIIYDGAHHDMDPSVPGQQAMLDDLLTFLVAKLPP